MRTNHLKEYDPRYSILLGPETEGINNGFRTFSDVIAIPLEDQRRAKLLPHRFKKTIRIYGCAPMALLSKPPVKCVHFFLKK